jgi:hypothetical protein
MKRFLSRLLAFSREVLESLPLEENSDDFLLITKCSLRRFISIIRSARYPARQSILRKHPLSALSGV